MPQAAPGRRKSPRPATRRTGRFVWERCNVSIHHAAGVGFEELHTILLPALTAAAMALDTGLPGTGESWSPDCVRLNGAGDFTCGGTEGDNGLSGKKLAVDFYGPMAPLGGGAMCGKDPHKSIASARSVCGGSQSVSCGTWALARRQCGCLGYPVLEAPDSLIANVDGEWWDQQRIRRSVSVPDLSIEGTFRDLELQQISWEGLLREGTSATHTHGNAEAATKPPRQAPESSTESANRPISTTR